MANSGTVTAGSAALASQYNNLRDDVLNVSTGHTHTGASENGAKVAATGMSSGTAANGTILTADGAGAASFLASTAGMTLIATATPSTATSLAFTSIPGTYKHLQLVWFDVFQSVGSGWWGVRFSNNSTPGQYFYRRDGVNTQTEVATMVGTTNQFAPVGATTTSGTAYNGQAKGTLDIWRYTESTNKFFRLTATSDPTDPQVNFSGVYLGSAAITSLDFVRSSTQTITGKFYLYGVS